jgi:PAS domain S-box-containing protein
VKGIPTHILLIEDNPGDAGILRTLLAETEPGQFTLTHVDRLSQGTTALRKGGIDIVLLDLSLPDSQGFATLIAMHKVAAEIPIVVMTGIEDEALGIQLIQQGAQDYLVKGQVTGPLLQRSLRYALERVRMANELRQKTTLLQSVLDSMAEGVVTADNSGAFQVWNPAAQHIVGSGPLNVETDAWSERFGLFLRDMVTPYPPGELPLMRAIHGESVNDILVFVQSRHRPSGGWLSVNARPLRDEAGHIRGGVAVFRDVTERRRTEEALRHSQERYELLVTRASDIIYRTDAMGRFTFINPVAMRLMKYSEQELLNRRFVDLIHPDHQAAAERFYGRQFVRQTPSTYYEFPALAKDGSEVWIGQNVQILLEDGKAIGFQAVARDITERKRVQAALSASEERFRSLVSNLPGAVYRCACDSVWTMEFLSDPIKHLCGYPASDFLANNIRTYASVIYPDDLQMVERIVLGAVAQRRPFSIEYRLLHKDGSIRWVYEKGQGIFAADGQVLWLDGVIFDITDRKRVEEALLESEERSRSIVQSTSDAIILMDSEGNVAFWNNGAETIFGYAADEMVGQPVTRIIPERFREAHQRGVQRVAAAGHLTMQATMFELVGLTKDGREFPLEFSLAAWTARSRLFITGIIRDISERVKAEEALRASEARFKAIMDHSPSMIFLKDANGRYLQINRKTEQTLGLPGTDIIGKTDNELFPSEQAAAFRAHDRQVLETGIPMEFEESATHDRGPRTYIVVKFPLFSPQGECYALCGMTTDITDRKRAEETLHRSEELLRSVINNATAAIYAKRVDGQYLMVNPRFEQLFHVTADQIRGKTDHDIFSKDIADVFRNNDQWVITNGIPLEIEEYAPHADGLHTYLSVKVPILDQAGLVSGMCGISTDITERKRAEEERQKLAKERLLLLDSTGDGIYGIDPEGRCTFINKAGAKMLGYEPDEVRGKNMHQLIHHSFEHGSAYPRQECPVYEALHSGQGFHIDNEVLWRKDGTTFPADYSCDPIVEEDIITGAVVTFVDITVRNRLEKERSQRAHRLIRQQSALTELTRSRFFQSSDLQRALRHITEMAARTLDIERVSLWRYSEDREAIHCIDRYELTHDRHAQGLTIPVGSRPEYFQALRTSQMIAIDDVRLDERTARFYAGDLAGEGITSRMDVPLYLFGQLMGVICHEHIGPAREWMEDEWMFAVAVSNVVALAYEEDERKRAETQLQQSQERLRSLTGRLESIQEEERIRIAREVHDELGQALTGVKLELVFLRNHLGNVEPSILDKVESIVKLVDRTMQSVRKIATELRPVVLDQLGLIPAIEWQAREFQTRTGISCRLNIYLRTVALPIDRATGVFRIFQEILTNVVRHAQATRVEISMQEHMGHLLVQVTDNGRGITDGEVSGSHSLGLIGMRERALLLGGETKIERLKQGTMVTVRVPLDERQPE